MALGAAVIIGGLFSGELVKRYERAYQHRTLLSFDKEFFKYNKDYFSYNRSALGNSDASWVRGLQHQIGEGAGIMAFISVPFHLDFSRNPIFTFAEPALVTPWFDFPLDDPDEVARNYLIDRGIQFVMFEHHGYGMKSDSIYKSYLELPQRKYRKLGRNHIRFRKNPV